MAVIRVEKNKNFTTMSNYHLRDKELSLKAKGLLSQILSLPENWDYSVRGLVAICLEGKDCIVTTLQELERKGYSDYEVIQTYSTESSRYSISANRNDSNVTGCCRGRKIRVRAIDADGNPGKWSEYSTVGCNSIRG